MSKNNLKILLFHQYFLEEDDHGGSRWNEIAKQWTSEGNEVTVIAGMMHYNSSKKREEYKGKFIKVKQQGNVKVIRCHVSESYNANFLGRLWGYFSFVFSSLFAGLFNAKGKYDVVIVTSPPLFIGISGYLVSKIKRVPYVFEIRDLWPESAIDTGVVSSKLIINIAYKLEKFIYKNAKLINVLTPAFRTKLIENKNVPSEKIIFIPNAADFNLSEKLLQNFNVTNFKKEHELEHKFVITYVGAHGKANALEQILYTAKLLKDTNVLFLLIGEGMEKKKLVEIANNEKIENVRFVDPVPKSVVFEYVLASDMGASVLKNVPTFKTVYSNKTFDYMSCKKPILMAIDGVSRDLVEDAKAGSFILPENPEDFANKIKFYLNNPQNCISEGENGYKFAKENFDRNVIASKYLQHIKECIHV
ncbi:glycosyltransferase family 4 protein [Flavobacterium urocaniciphilum]|uniref:Glycosyltransferase involved in cell wall bisynthesis n=1 Tax=Flavobacterium urocaniciphilum TaxID=1299341 RepID=A0A1H8YS13_9FLAO|nr:glycosyltransferase family 4 protein [Flavobacterium urocaniciphilum]SEP54791.1 Glycosyltransferase involved in cell wall bisynthesis [Flavobacterium urocaniciphilum]